MGIQRQQDNDSKLEELVDLYEDGYNDIQSILVDGDLTAEEQLDSIADILFDHQVGDE